MRLAILALLSGEALALAGLACIYWPLALVAAGVQLVVASLVVDA